MFTVSDTTPAPYTVNRQTFSPSVASIVLTATNGSGETLVVPEPVALFNKVKGMVTIQSRRAVNSVTFYGGDWTGYNLKYKK